MKVTGPIKPNDFPETINSDNFYLTTQSYAEDNFFPGSIRKQSYLHAVSATLMDKIIRSGPLEKLRILNVIYDQLEKHQIFIWLEDEQLADYLTSKHWNGLLDNYSYDYFYPVESNLGANKANFAVTRNIEQNIDIYPVTRTTTKITWNNGVNEFKWGGDYINYQRIIIPKNASIEKIIVNENELTLQNDKSVNVTLEPKGNLTYQTTENGNFLEIGFWVIVPEGKTNKAEISYKIPKSSDYHLIFKRQPGIYEIPYRLSVGNKLVVDKIIDSDFEFGFDSKLIRP